MLRITEQAVADVKKLIEGWQKYLEHEDPVLRAHAEGTVSGLETALMTLGLLKYAETTQAKRLGSGLSQNEYLGERNWLDGEEIRHYVALSSDSPVAMCGEFVERCTDDWGKVTCRQCLERRLRMRR